jgi:hypothetical protein
MLVRDLTYCVVLVVGECSAVQEEREENGVVEFELEYGWIVAKVVVVVWLWRVSRPSNGGVAWHSLSKPAVRS